VYRGLIKAFRATRTAAAAGGWPEFPPGPKLERGDVDPRVEALRTGLLARGDIALSESFGRNFFDGELEEGVKSFQCRHGLQPGGIVGPATEAALNVPVEVRLTQILANLERWRWIIQDLGEKYILINIADFRVGVFEGVREDILPKVRKDPGPRNSLGRIKFMFPNKFDVYLHDTSDRRLFAQAGRDLSSGCIRLER
jgi:L,D-transpeptidase YcbB